MACKRPKVQSQEQKEGVKGGREKGKREEGGREGGKKGEEKEEGEREGTKHRIQQRPCVLAKSHPPGTVKYAEGHIITSYPHPYPEPNHCHQTKLAPSGPLSHYTLQTLRSQCFLLGSQDMVCVPAFVTMSQSPCQMSPQQHGWSCPSETSLIQRIGSPSTPEPETLSTTGHILAHPPNSKISKYHSSKKTADDLTCFFGFGLPNKSVSAANCKENVKPKRGRVRKYCKVKEL